jgi:GTPase SAR1 family protein
MEQMREGDADPGPPIQPQSRSGLADINIAVIGSAGVGKSTLIQRALGLRTLPTSIASSQRMSVDNVPYTVSLIEIELESFDINPERRIQWPKQINGHIVPRMDGALLLYDVMNRESIQELPQTLSRSKDGVSSWGRANLCRWLSEVQPPYDPRVVQVRQS